MKKSGMMKLLSGLFLMMVMLVSAAVPALAEETELKEMSAASVGGVSYYYTNIDGDAEGTVYQATVKSRAGSTAYQFALSELKQAGETSYYYTAVPAGSALTGTVYGFAEGTPTNYREVYADLGVNADSSYDAISSATKYTGHHAKDIPSLVTFGTDSSGDKAITGLELGREVKSFDADAYVEAAVLQAAGAELTDAQTDMLKVALKANPMTAPSTETITPVLGSASFTTSRYGKGEFAIVPDETVPGYVWSEYWSNVYAATISDGTTTVGAVHWIDLYGEAATSGPHYNKLEIAVNNGTSTASNQADVNRYAAFFDEATGTLRPGTYTIKVYAEGYDVLEAVVEVPAVEMDSVTVGGIAYYYADTASTSDAFTYQATVKSRAGSTSYQFALSDLKRAGETSYYYTAVPAASALTGTVYGFAEGTPTNYREVYADLGVNADSSYDAISSATKYTGHHAKDIPSLVTFGTDSNGDKAITGLELGREVKSFDADAYVEAAVLQAAGAELTDAQADMLKVALKANPMSAPSTETITPVLRSASFTTSKYGKGEFDIVPDDTVSGYVWSEYWSNIYAATISDGTTTVGAVHWIDMYGEAATSGKHYNLLQIAMNNGTSTASNQADVNRYAAFFDDRTGEMKSGTYTIKVYAEGYDTLQAEVEIPVSEAEIKADAVDEANKAVSEAEKITEDEYPEESVKAVQEAAAELKNVLADENSSTEDIKAAAKALTDAVAAAEKAKEEAAKEEEEKAAAKAEAEKDAAAAQAAAAKIDASYPEANVKEVADAAEALKEVLAKEDATAEEIEAATKALADAVEKAEKAKAEASKTDDSKTDESKADGSKTEESKADESKADGSKTDGSKTEESKADDSKTAESKPDESKPAETEAAKPANTVKKGDVYTVNKMKYKVTNADLSGKGTVTLTGSTVKASKLKKLTVPASIQINGVTFKVTAIKKKAFNKYKKLTKVTIGNNVATIGNSAFAAAAKLKTVTVGTGVKKIGKSAFAGDKKLKTLTIKSKKLTSVGKNAIKGIQKKATIKVPKKMLKKYKKLFNKKAGYVKTMKIKK